jgi:short-subunit dehydrogenase
MELNVLSLIALPNDGAIVNVVSDTGKVGCPNIAIYSLSQTAVIKPTRSFEVCL